VGGAPGAGNNHLHAPLMGRFGVLFHDARGAVGREDAHFVRHVKLVEHVGSVFHDGQVGIAAHGDADRGRRGGHSKGGI
jgi:hypothetical protein